jgi:hypothetical protein
MDSAEAPASNEREGTIDPNAITTFSVETPQEMQAYYKWFDLWKAYEASGWRDEAILGQLYVVRDYCLALSAAVRNNLPYPKPIMDVMDSSDDDEE